MQGDDLVAKTRQFPYCTLGWAGAEARNHIGACMMQLFPSQYTVTIATNSCYAYARDPQGI
jgi:hypothetical protein